MNKIVTVAVYLLAVLSFGCGDDSTGPSSEPAITLQLIDAPGNLAHAWVEIGEIRLQGSSDEGGGGVVLVEESSGMIDLLTLVDAATDLVRDKNVPAGTYTQLRLVVDNAIVETDQGDVFGTDNAVHPEGKEVTGELQCPSCEQTGIKVKLPGGNIRLDEETRIIMLDFDVSESFGKQAGGSGRWVMRPVIHSSELTTSGNISGTVSLANGVSVPDCGGEARDLSAFVPQAADEEGLIRSGHTDASGAFDIKYVAPGEYTTGFAATVEYEEESLEFEADASAASVTVEMAQTTQLDYVITAASCR